MGWKIRMMRPMCPPELKDICPKCGGKTIYYFVGLPGVVEQSFTCKSCHAQWAIVWEEDLQVDSEEQKP